MMTSRRIFFSLLISIHFYFYLINFLDLNFHIDLLFFFLFFSYSLCHFQILVNFSMYMYAYVPKGTDNKLSSTATSNINLVQSTYDPKDISDKVWYVLTRTFSTFFHLFFKYFLVLDFSFGSCLGLKCRMILKENFDKYCYIASNDYFLLFVHASKE